MLISRHVSWYLKPCIWSYIESNGRLSEQWKTVIGRFTVMWNKEIWGFSAINLNFWLTSESSSCLVQWEEPEMWVFLEYVANRHIHSCGSFVFPWLLRWNRSTGIMTFMWILIQISSTYLSLGVLSRFDLAEMPFNTIFRQMHFWLGIHVFKFFRSVLFPR